MNRLLSSFTLLLALGAAGLLHGQAAPTAAPTATPATAPGTVATLGHSPSAGDLFFSLSASEAIENGYQGVSGTSTSTNLAGSASFVSSSEVHPLSLVYSGGYFFGDGGGFPASTFQNFGISQALRTRNWRFSVADGISYLPASPVFGTAGVAGVGDTGTIPIDIGNLPTQSILTNYSTRITNTASASADRRITGSTSAYGFGAYGIQRFPDSGSTSIDNNQVTASTGLNHRFSALNSGGVNYSYYRFTFGAADALGRSTSFYSHGINAEFQHTFSRKMSLSLAGGPQWTRGNDKSVISSRLDAAASVTLSYLGELSRASGTYSRGSNSGSGVVLGSISDNLDFTYQRAFGRSWEAGLIADYGRASGLTIVLPTGVVSAAGTNPTTTNSFYGGIQGTRRVGRYLSVFASYNGLTQNVGGQSTTTTSANIFNGVANIISFGVTLSPRPIHLGQF